MKAPRTSLCIALTFATAVVALAQGARPPGGGGGGFRGQGGQPGGQGGQFPRGGRTGPRDSMPQPTGTAILRGRVVGGESGGPLAARGGAAAGRGDARGQDGDDRRAGTLGDERPAGRPLQRSPRPRAATSRCNTASAVPSSRGGPSSSPTTRRSRTSTSTCRAAASSRAASTTSSASRSPRRSVLALRYRYFNGQRRLVPAAAGRRPTTAGISGSTGLPPGDYYLSATLRDGHVFGDAESTPQRLRADVLPRHGQLAAGRARQRGAWREVTGITFALLPVRTARITRHRSGLARAGR